MRYLFLEICADHNDIIDFEENFNALVGEECGEEGYWLRTNRHDYGWSFDSEDRDRAFKAYRALQDAFGARAGWTVTFTEHEYKD